MNVFEPEISPFHKVDFSIACMLEVTGATAGDILKAGKFMYSKAAGKIKNNPVAGCTATATGTVSGILMHDVVLDPAITEYPVGILISGVVYDDVVATANGGTTIDPAIKTELMKQGTLFYNVKTMK